MTQGSHDDRFLGHVKARLEASEGQLDELTRARLGAARRRALEVGGQGPAWSLGDLLVWGRGLRQGLVIGLLLLSLGVALQFRAPSTAPQQMLPLFEDMELLGESEELDLYQELDFYLWVAGEHEAG